MPALLRSSFGHPKALRCSRRRHSASAWQECVGVVRLVGRCGNRDDLEFWIHWGRRSGRASTNYQLVYGRLMSSHVYLLRDKNHARFKIGKANNILSRARNFSWDCIDFSASVGLKVTTEAEAYALENILHRTFRHARLQVGDIIATGGSADGGTEWFDVSCWARLLQYLVDNQDLHNHEYVNGELLASEIVKIRQSSEGGLLRAAFKADQERLRDERMNERRKLHAEQLDLLRVCISNMWPKLRAELDYQRREKQIYGVTRGSSLILVSDR